MARNMRIACYGNAKIAPEAFPLSNRRSRVKGSAIRKRVAHALPRYRPVSVSSLRTPGAATTAPALAAGSPGQPQTTVRPKVMDSPATAPGVRTFAYRA